MKKREIKNKTILIIIIILIAGGGLYIQLANQVLQGLQ
jgi:hypothetical protein